MEHLEISSVKSKRQFYELFHRGVFGNHGPMWNTIDEMLADPHYKRTSPKVAIRSRVPGGNCIYNIPPSRIQQVYRTFLCKGYSPEQLQFSEMVPINNVTIQGYAKIDHLGLHFEHSLVKKPMRDALEEQLLIAHRLEARLMLQSYMLPVCFDWLQHIFDVFPDSVVEFTCLNKPWGTLPGWNTVFWEVRNY